MDCWKLLGIEETADKRKIRSAYAKLLKQNHPEDNPREYQSIREAYDYALMIAEYLQHEEDQDAELTHNSALAPPPSEQVQLDAEQSLPPLRERDRVRGIQLETIDSTLAKLVPLLQRDDGVVIEFCRTTLCEDFFQALDVRYEFEGRLLVTLQQNDLLPFAFLEYLEQEFQWDIDLDRPEWMAIGHFDDDIQFSDAFYAVAHRYITQIVRKELRVHLQSTHSWLAVERLDQIDALLFTTGRELELAEFCEAKQNRELIKSAIAFLTKHQYIANHPSFVPRETLEWLVSQQIAQAVELAQPKQSLITELIELNELFFPISSILCLVYFFIKGVIYVGQDSSFNFDFNRPTSSRPVPSEYFDVNSDSDGTSDRKKEMYWLQRAADQGNEPAREKLGIWYYKNATGAQDYKLAVDMLTSAADHGRAEATFWLARVFDEGKAVERDGVKARQLLDRSIELGSIDAMRVNGFKLIHGLGWELNRDKGVEFLQKASDQGDLNATYQLALEYLSGNALDINYEQAIKLLERLTTQEAPIGQFWLSQLYEKGLGVSKDSTRAAQLLAKARNLAQVATVNKFAWQLATQPNKQLRNGDLAVKLMEHLLEHRTSTKPFLIDTLAAAYAEAGKFDKAVQAQQRALRTLPADSTAKERREYEAKLKLYQNSESL